MKNIKEALQFILNDSGDIGVKENERLTLPVLTFNNNVLKAVVFSYVDGIKNPVTGSIGTCINHMYIIDAKNPSDIIKTQALSIVCSTTSIGGRPVFPLSNDIAVKNKDGAYLDGIAMIYNSVLLPWTQFQDKFPITSVGDLLDKCCSSYIAKLQIFRKMFCNFESANGLLIGNDKGLYRNIKDTISKIKTEHPVEYNMCKYQCNEARLAVEQMSWIFIYASLFKQFSPSNLDGYMIETYADFFMPYEMQLSKMKFIFQE